MNKLKLVAIENKKIYKDKFYINSSGKKIDLSEDINNVLLKTCFYEDINITKKLTIKQNSR